MTIHRPEHWKPLITVTYMDGGRCVWKQYHRPVLLSDFDRPLGNDYLVTRPSK